VIFVSTPPTSLAVKASATIDAAAIYPNSAVGASENTAVTYSMSCSSAGACGSFSASDEGGAMVYTAPSAIPSGSTVTITATSVADTALSVSAKITIVPPIPISLVFMGEPPASMQVGSSISFGVNIENDVTANPQVQWTATCGGSACGTFSPSTTTSTQPTTYTAPATIPPGGSVRVTATSLTDATKLASATIVITPTAPTLADGTYVFQISGSPATGATFVTGVLVAKSGAITGGEQDSILSDDNGGFYSDFAQITGGTYATTADGNQTITLQIGPGETEALHGTLTSSGNGFVSGIDGVPGTAILNLQTSAAAPSGGYALSLSGNDVYESPAWIGGVLNIDSAGKISGNGTTLDVIDGPPGITNPQSLAASTVSAPDTYGRVLFQLNPASSAQLPALEFAGYMVDANHIWLSQVGSPNNSNYIYFGTAGGTALGQGSSAGRFSASSVAGSSYVIGAQGEDTEGPLQIVGALTFNPGGSVSGTLSWNDLSAAAPQSPVTCTGSYTIDPSGRVTITNLADSNKTFNYSFDVYLAQGGGLVLSSGSGPLFAGQAFLRQSGTFAASSFSGAYGLNASLYSSSAASYPQWSNAVGSVTVATSGSADTMTGFADSNANPADVAVSGSLTAAADGIFTGTLSGPSVASNPVSGNFALYLVNGTQGIAMETDMSQLNLSNFVQIQ